ncbi:lethal(2) giant larvae protein homolog 1-like isoform X4 [Acanthaster planci]|uniref:Lethal(2) giant larvae protein homolog 1-like isoform X4 n=1 Tax=Acanthaster planci TaxID=133434 RepID=A0A8B7XXF7_ACAPL|nr:lethal(2) giant larvae protein homolog 1-like isoform X4 [Acanthaster planci]
MASKIKGIFHRKPHAPSAERQRIQKELFAFNKTVEHGFPHKPSALAYDPKLKLLAVGTQSGVIKIYGAPGVEFIGVHEGESAVWQLFFLPEQGRIISLLQDNSLHLWEVNIKDGNSVLEEVKSFSLEGRLKKISVCCLSADCKTLYMGTEGGNIYLLNVATFDMDELIIYQDVVMQKLRDSSSSFSVPDDYKVNPGPVEAIAQHPTDDEKLLIGYNRGLIVVWHPKELTAEQTFVSNQQLESLCWHRDGLRFTSAHNDGSYCVWNAQESSQPEKEPVIPYGSKNRPIIDGEEMNGPFPCKAINKLKYLTTKSDPFMIFSGGMPRASYGDRHCVTVMQGNKHVVLDFTSKVIDFFTMSDVDAEYEFDEPHTLVVLVEEEIVFIDLQSEGWPVFNLPYLSSLHASAITCQQHVSNVPSELWDKIVAAGEQQMANNTSQREWPMNGGKNLAELPTPHDLLMTGHEDGTVRFWDASTVSLKFLYKLSTAQAFVTEADHADAGVGETEGEWPPFRKVGNFDPFSDDPRLGIQRIVLCPVSGSLLVGGTAGQVVILNIGTEEVEKTVESFPIQIVGEQDKFVWKGHESLGVKEDALKFAPGFQPSMVVQAQPPASITALALQTSWGLAGLGTSHGFALFDTVQKKLVSAHCTLNPNDLSSTGQPMTRKRSMAKSLRASIRRLRKRRDHRAGSPKKERAEGGASGSGEGVQTTDIDADKPEGKEDSGAKSSPTREMAQVERKIEARSDDTKTSMVRCLYFANTFVNDSQVATPSLWCGTNAGSVIIYVISIPGADKRDTDAVEAMISKEIRLKHGAPVVSLVIVDSDTYPLPDPIDVQNERAKPPNMSGHSLIVCSEEQFKVFHLPSLKPFRKTKLTAHDGSKVRKVSYINFRSRSDDNYSENCISCLTNLGELAIYSIPALKKQLGFSALRKENVAGIQSLIFTSRGEGFYLLSPSELERFSLSARYFTEPMCMLELPEGMRPPPPEPEPEPAPQEPEAPVDGHPIAEEAPPAEEPAAVAEEAAPAEESAPPASDDAAPETRTETTTVVVQETDMDDPMMIQSGTTVKTVKTSSTTVVKTERTLISSSSSGDQKVVKTTEETVITSGGDHQTPEELHNEVDELLAKIPNISVNLEGDTEENPDITLDEVREYGKDEQAGEVHSGDASAERREGKGVVELQIREETD